MPGGNPKQTDAIQSSKEGNLKSTRLTSVESCLKERIAEMNSRNIKSTKSPSKALNASTSLIFSRNLHNSITMTNAHSFTLHYQSPPHNTLN